MKFRLLAATVFLCSASLASSSCKGGAYFNCNILESAWCTNDLQSLEHAAQAQRKKAYCYSCEDTDSKYALCVKTMHQQHTGRQPQITCGQCTN
ncbi:hypothetical protein CROQUDRAFT_656853 [Cronartium quercuum f. sp. fusiforme G11]|uniref:Secreted protein n=1 Tax=Cronartium quercuum f. sp. fusiforme G11 TaxID=708437 RepID=A0A9P6NJQ7_9BASI|nr:hypothetical protein CROQUDRAFT_656853 [Cronartium quercuum f. sp. fusiforme G11]